MTTKQKIPQHFIDDLIAKADIIELIGERVKIKRSGTNWYGKCPFHQENTPSFSVSQTKQFYYCFGCKASGNIIQFIMEYHHYTFLETIEMLANQYGLTIPVELHNAPQASHENDHQMLANIAQYYHQELLQTSAALNYLKQRNLSTETIKYFQIGYVPDQWRFVLNQFGNNKAARQQLEKLGMIITKQDHCYDRFRNRIMFPIHNMKEQAIGFGGRVTDNSTPKYLNSPETALYHKSEELFGLNHLRRQPGKINKILVVEGYMDVIALANKGVNYAVATLGTAITPGHLKKLLRQCQHLIFCFDGDQAGHTAAWKALTTALPHAHDGVHITFCFLPQGEDPDSYINQNGKESLEQLLDQGQTLSDYFFQKLCAQPNSQSLDQKAALAKKATSYLNTMPEGIFKTLLLKSLSDTIQLPIEAITKHHTLNTPPPAPAANNKQFKSPSKPSPIRQAITLLVNYPDIARHINQIPTENDQTPGMNCLKELLDILQNNKSIQNTGVLLQHLEGSKWVKQLAALASEDVMTTQNDGAQTFNALIQQYLTRKTDVAIKQLIKQASQGILSTDDKLHLQKLIKQQKDEK